MQAKNSVKLHVKNANAFWSSRDFLNCLRECELVLEIEKNQHQAIFLKSQCLFALKKDDLALDCLVDGMANKAINAKFDNQVRAASILLGRFDVGLPMSIKIFETNPDDARNQIFLFQSYMSVGDVLSAEKLVNSVKLDSARGVPKEEYYLSHYHSLRRQFPVISDAWLYSAEANNHQVLSLQEDTVINDEYEPIQYWSQGDVPEDVAIVNKAWNEVLSSLGLKEIVVYSRETAFKWISQNAPEFRDSFSKAFHYAMESDIFRIAFSSKRPAIYIDVDCWPLKHASSIINCALINKRSLLYLRSYRPWVLNGFFVSRPECRFFKELKCQALGIDLTILEKTAKSIEWSFGPSRYNDVLKVVVSNSKTVSASRINDFKGSSLIRWDDEEIMFSSESAVTSVRPPFSLDYKSTDSYWKRV